MPGDWCRAERYCFPKTGLQKISVSLHALGSSSAPGYNHSFAVSISLATIPSSRLINLTSVPGFIKCQLSNHCLSQQQIPTHNFGGVFWVGKPWATWEAAWIQITVKLPMRKTRQPQRWSSDTCFSKNEPFKAHQIEAAIPKRPMLHIIQCSQGILKGQVHVT